VVAPHAGHEFLVQFAYNPDGERQGFEPGDAMFERGHVVADLAQIFRASRDHGPSIGCQQFAERGLRSLDAAGKHRFALHERADEKMRIRQPPTLAGQTTE
jgi:hypothetical protein